MSYFIHDVENILNSNILLETTIETIMLDEEEKDDKMSSLFIYIKGWVMEKVLFESEIFNKEMKGTYPFRIKVKEIKTDSAH